MAVESPAFANQASTYGAEQTRRAVFLPFSTAGGVKASGDLAVTAPVSGMTVNVATGDVLVPGSSSSTQGLYYGRVTSTTNLAIAAANPSNPRIDMVYAAITDAAYTGATNTFVVAVATGTPTSGATLVNLNGAPALPTSAIILAYCLVPANATNIITADLSDQRVRTALSNTASTASTSVQTFAGNVSAPILIAAGSTGAASAIRLIGGNATGAPASGTWLTYDIAESADGKLWCCTAGGTPGTWSQVGASYSVASATVATNQTTSNTSYTDLATTGPAPSIVIGPSGVLVVTVSAYLSPPTSDGCWMSYALSGGTTVAASDTEALMFVCSTGTSVLMQGSRTKVHTGITAGVTVTATAKYKSNAGGGSGFQNRDVKLETY